MGLEDARTPRVRPYAGSRDHHRPARPGRRQLGWLPHRPSLIIVDTHIGWGSPHRQDTKEAHGEALGVEEVRLTKSVYGWPPDSQFLVPDEVKEYMGKAVERGAQWQQDWDQRYNAWAKEFPDLAKMWQQMVKQE